MNCPRLSLPHQQNQVVSTKHYFLLGNAHLIVIYYNQPTSTTGHVTMTYIFRGTERKERARKDETGRKGWEGRTGERVKEEGVAIRLQVFYDTLHHYTMDSVVIATPPGCSLEHGEEWWDGTVWYMYTVCVYCFTDKF